MTSFYSYILKADFEERGVGQPAFLKWWFSRRQDINSLRFYYVLESELVVTGEKSR
jgi:hypothetical protein